MTSDSPGLFSLTVAFEESRAVLHIRGEVDCCHAPEVRAVLDAMIDLRHHDVIMDVGELEFIDASGLGVIAHGVGRLGPLGGVLTIRSPSAMLSRLLEITGMTALVRLDHVASDVPHLGAEQGTEQKASSATRGNRGPPLKTASAARADDDVVDAALRLVVSLARVTVGGADGVSVSLRRHGRLATVAASDRTISEMDADQYATGEGPCVDASVNGRWFHAESMEAERRWPAFTPRARALGINAILSSPLLVADRPVGALNIYSRSVGAFAPEDQELASVFATEASAILTEAGLDLTDEQVAQRVTDAQWARLNVALAQGITMEREGIGADAAYTLLREFSQRSGRPLRERAQDIVSSTIRPSSADSRGTDHG